MSTFFKELPKNVGYGLITAGIVYILGLLLSLAGPYLPLFLKAASQSILTNWWQLITGLSATVTAILAILSYVSTNRRANEAVVKLQMASAESEAGILPALPSVEQIKEEIRIDLASNNPVSLVNLPPLGSISSSIPNVTVIVSIHNFSDALLIVKYASMSFWLGQPWCDPITAAGSKIRPRSMHNVLFEAKLSDAQQRFAWQHISRGVLRDIIVDVNLVFESEAGDFELFTHLTRDRLVVFNVNFETDPSTQPVAPVKLFPPRLYIKLSDSIEPSGTYIVGYVHNIGEQAARDVRLWLPVIGKEGHWNLAPDERHPLRFKWDRRQDDAVGGDSRQIAFIEYTGDTSVYQQKQEVQMPLDHADRFRRVYRLESDAMPIEIDGYTIKV